MRRQSAGSGGFTLLELLLAILLLSVILTALYSTFFLSRKAIDGVDDALLLLQEYRKTVDVMMREVDSSVYDSLNKYSLFKVEDRDFFGKQASRLTFTTFSPLRPGLSLISYYVEEKEGVLTLYKKLSLPYEKSEDETAGADVIEGIQSFTVEVNDGGTWIKTWDSSETKRRPDEIRMTLTVLMKDRPVTLQDVIVPKIGGPLS